MCVSDVEVDVDELNTEQELDLNKMATPYGMAEGDFVRSVCLLPLYVLQKIVCVVITLSLESMEMPVVIKKCILCFY